MQKEFQKNDLIIYPSLVNFQPSLHFRTSNTLGTWSTDDARELAMWLLDWARHVEQNKPEYIVEHDAHCGAI